MRRFSLTVTLRVATFAFAAVSFAAAASAQSDAQRSGCTRDVSRLCRSVMDAGDSAVLSCLQQNRARLSKTCQKVLTDNGQ